MSSKLRIGIAGTGGIARVIADAIDKSQNAIVAGVAGRDKEKSKAFVTQFAKGALAFENWQEMLASSAIDAVYIGTPTATKEEIALSALKKGKHVLVDKPLASLDSVSRMITIAQQSGAVLMDATHFVHHPRTQKIKAEIEKLGPITSLRSAFHFPFEDRNNIRFNPELEPMGALGDLGWYNMRATVEFLAHDAEPESVAATLEMDRKHKTPIRGAGLLTFSGNRTASWDIGYTSGAVAMDLDIIGTKGILSVDDFVLDWSNSFVFQNPELNPTYQIRKGVTPRPKAETIEVQSPLAAHVLMIDNFAAAVEKGAGSSQSQEAVTKLYQTQKLLQRVWTLVS